MIKLLIEIVKMLIKVGALDFEISEEKYFQLMIKFSMWPWVSPVDTWYGSRLWSTLKTLRLGPWVLCPLNTDVIQDKYDLGVKMQPLNVGK